MATMVRPLNGAEGYLRWKESMLLRLHIAGVAHVLSDDPPPSGGGGGEGVEAAPAATLRKWARDDAVCRGHILAALSDRLFPDYVRHATARALWEAVARTYDVDVSRVAQRRFYDLVFDEGAPLLEQIAHAEALAAGMDPPLGDDSVAYSLCNKLPEEVATPVIVGNCDMSMSKVWKVARLMEKVRIGEEYRQLHERCENCGELGHDASNCMP